MFVSQGMSVLNPGFDSSLLRDANSTVSPLKWSTVTVLPMNLRGSSRTPPASTQWREFSSHLTLLSCQPCWRPVPVFRSVTALVSDSGSLNSASVSKFFLAFFFASVSTISQYCLVLQISYSVSHLSTSAFACTSVSVWLSVWALARTTLSASVLTSFLGSRLFNVFPSALVFASSSLSVSLSISWSTST